jgi:hypothetical protein
MEANPDPQPWSNQCPSTGSAAGLIVLTKLVIGHFFEKSAVKNFFNLLMNFQFFIDLKLFSFCV